MCGIVYAHDFEGKSVNNGVLNLFDKQRSRGTSGFGLFDGSEGNIIRAVTEDKILKWLCKYDSNLILFHHRFPTSTSNTKSTAHPFSTRQFFGKSQYILVHNGHISNSQKLKTKHEALGIKYRGLDGAKFNDSEALLWDLALYLEAKQDKLEAVGSMAFVAIKLTDGQLDKLYFGRNSNPLNMLKVKQGIVLSSEGLGEAIESRQLYTWNYQLKRLTNKYLSMPTSDYPAYQFPVRKPWPIPAVPEIPTAYKGYEYVEEEDDYSQSWEDQLDDAEQRKIDKLTMKYMIGHRGVFEAAYNDMEFDYMQIAEDVQAKEEYQQMRLYEAALSELETDPEWLDNTSTSSLWLPIDKQIMLTEGGLK